MEVRFQFARSRLHGPILLDSGGRVHTLVGAEQPTLLVTDRHGTVYWRDVVLDYHPDTIEMPRVPISSTWNAFVGGAPTKALTVPRLGPTGSAPTKAIARGCGVYALERVCGDRADGLRISADVPNGSAD